MYVEISYKTVSKDQILKARSNTITEGKVRYVVICLGYKKNSGNPPPPVEWVPCRKGSGSSSLQQTAMQLVG